MASDPEHGVADSTAAQEAPRFINPGALPPPRGYSHVVTVPPGNHIIFVSGQVPLDSTGRVVGVGDFRAQARQVFENLRAALAASGATFRDVVKVTVFLRDSDSLRIFREVRDQYINPAAPPASSLVVVRGLLREELLLEVEAVAAVSAGRPRGIPPAR